MELTCDFCKKKFKRYNSLIKLRKHFKHNFCSKKCSSDSRKTGKKLRCFLCYKSIYVTDARFKKNKNKNKTFCCSQKCGNKNKQTGKKVICTNCKLPIYVDKSNLQKRQHHFCTHSCAATYNNTHKKHGTRRSKLEVWLEQQLIQLYPKLEIHFNKKETINSELDIYVPSLKLAFELNGIYHYEPIHGEELLSKIQNNDNRKFQACLEKEIELVIIDSSQQKYFKPKMSRKYLEIITGIINQKF